MNVTLLDHPETIPPHPRPWKNSSMKPVPGAKKVGDHCRRAFKREKEVLTLALSRLSGDQIKMDGKDAEGSKVRHSSQPRGCQVGLAP